MIEFQKANCFAARIHDSVQKYVNRLDSGDHDHDDITKFETEDAS